VEEIADIMEVIEALVEQVHGLKWEDVREIQGRKWEVRGGFDAGIVLERVEG
jgi:predicted house-cleaning noncanonical NTP pyrophosphatase (MazG superfamily)